MIRLERRLALAVTVNKDPESYDLMTLEQFQLEMDKVYVKASLAKVCQNPFISFEMLWNTVTQLKCCF